MEFPMTTRPRLYSSLLLGLVSASCVRGTFSPPTCSGNTEAVRTSDVYDNSNGKMKPEGSTWSCQALCPPGQHRVLSNQDEAPELKVGTFNGRLQKRVQYRCESVTSETASVNEIPDTRTTTANSTKNAARRLQSSIVTEHPDAGQPESGGWFTVSSHTSQAAPPGDANGSSSPNDWGFAMVVGGNRQRCLDAQDDSDCAAIAEYIRNDGRATKFDSAEGTEKHLAEARQLLAAGLLHAWKVALSECDAPNAIECTRLARWIEDHRNDPKVAQSEQVIQRAAPRLDNNNWAAAGQDDCAAASSSSIQIELACVGVSAYLKRFPSGRHAQAARSMLAAKAPRIEKLRAREQCEERCASSLGPCDGSPDKPTCVQICIANNCR